MLGDLSLESSRRQFLFRLAHQIRVNRFGEARERERHLHFYLAS